MGPNGTHAVLNSVWECFNRELDAESYLTDAPTLRQNALVERIINRLPSTDNCATARWQVGTTMTLASLQAQLKRLEDYVRIGIHLSPGQQERMAWLRLHIAALLAQPTPRAPALR